MSAQAEGGSGGRGGGGSGGSGGGGGSTSSRSPQQLQSPHCPRDRIRRGNSPLTVLINPPSLDDAVDGVVDTVDSLSLAIEELRATASGVKLRSFNQTGAAAFVPTDMKNCVVGGSGGSAGVGDISVDGGGGGSSGGSSGSRSDEEFLSVRPPNKRSSSLKSKKTPPGTPSQVKKAVRFADAFGLDLANVKHVLDPDNPPVIPPQATRDLQLGNADDDDEEAAARIPASAQQLQISASSDTPAATPAGFNSDEERGRRRALYAIRPAFSQPGNSAGFHSRVMAQKVVLESAAFVPPAEIQGFVRVVNLAFEKCVTVRATFDGWQSPAVEAAATYVLDSGTGMTDQFTFSLQLPAHALQQPGAGRSPAAAAFCIAYRAAGQTYWDNNFGENYTFDCVPAAAV